MDIKNEKLAQLEGDRDIVLRIYATTSPSPNHSIQDSVDYDDKTAVVGDGVSGNKGADFASKFATARIKRELSILKITSVKRAEEIIGKLFENVSSQLKSIATREPDKYWGMSTTISMVHILEEDEGRKIALAANTGDSKIYLLREGELVQITRDHNIIDERYPGDEAFKVQKAINNVNSQEDFDKLPQEYKRLSPYLNRLNRSVGGENAKPDFFAINLKDGDRILICSDGLSATDNKKKEILTEVKDTKEAAEKLVKASEKSFQYSQYPDDIAVIIIDAMKK